MDGRWTMSVSVCKKCDKGRDPLSVPNETCGHDPETHRQTIGVPVVPCDDEAVERAVGAVLQETGGLFRGDSARRVAVAVLVAAAALPAPSDETEEVA